MEPRGGMGDGFGDDFELEVSDLRSGRVLNTPDAQWDGVTTPGGDGDDGDDELAVSRLEVGEAGARRLLILGVSLVVFVAILLNVSGVRQGLSAVFQGSTPGPTGPLAPGADVFYFANGTQWGTLSIDGQSYPVNPSPSAVALTYGRHHLTYSAAPFTPLRCVISVPADAHDTCPLLTDVRFNDAPAATRVVDLRCSPDALPSDAFDALVRGVSARFATYAASGTIQPGEHLLGPDGRPAIASAALMGIVQLDLNLDASRGFSSGPGGSCVTFCRVGIFNLWQFQAHVLAHWSFATAAGSALYTSDTVVDTEIAMQATWLFNEDEWLLSQPDQSINSLGSFCQNALNGPPNGPAPFTITYNYYEATAAAAEPVNGCAEVVSPTNDVSGSTAGLASDAALFIYRFGLVLAGNTLAHEQQPQLPVATDSERITALRWFEPQG